MENKTETFQKIGGTSMKRRMLAIAAILALTAGGLAGCGSKEKSSGSSD
ncbi:TPA: sugar ABC transporter substrate-binding protein, partial [Enterococcus faecium]|nr:sugar ABC transporter substrate-binding protein [Enterococcus faecium]HBM5742636.1 sugar ABC transporter substrate-binding protein [Enterococcus faecium]HBM6087742.1 sugar ABC transporter substrate-binding protein [Enterococcus faecium]HBM6877218.1 sugar ABC transporter substrate-binding protein [Enterococcus faecium]HBM6924326.1 sugar ABC transporter substrate-binding protein [Enterococcus faecium]